MSSIDSGVLLVMAALGGFALWHWRLRTERMRHVETARLPPGIFDKLRKQRPDIAPEHFPRIERALRDFFAAYLLSGRKPVSMPSQAADALWHEFILYTRHYDAFCRQAFGRFLHHTPAVVLSQNHDRNTGLRRVWWHLCKREGLDPRTPARLPMLFALDAQLGLADGYRYALDCHALRDRDSGAGIGIGCGGGTQCASDMHNDGFDGTTDGFGSSGGSDSGDGGSGDGGGGCSGD